MNPSVQVFIDIVGKHPEEMEKGDTILSSEIALRLLMAIGKLQKERDFLRQQLRAIATNTETPGRDVHQLIWLIETIHQQAKITLGDESRGQNDFR